MVAAFKKPNKVNGTGTLFCWDIREKYEDCPEFEERQKWNGPWDNEFTWFLLLIAIGSIVMVLKALIAYWITPQ